MKNPAVLPQGSSFLPRKGLKNPAKVEKFLQLWFSGAMPA